MLVSLSLILVFETKKVRFKQQTADFHTTNKKNTPTFENNASKMSSGICVSLNERIYVKTAWEAEAWGEQGSPAGTRPVWQAESCRRLQQVSYGAHRRPAPSCDSPGGPGLPGGSHSSDSGPRSHSTASWTGPGGLRVPALLSTPDPEASVRSSDDVNGPDSSQSASSTAELWVFLSSHELYKHSQRWGPAQPIPLRTHS